MGNKTVPEIALAFCLESFQAMAQRQSTPVELKRPPKLGRQGGESPERSTQRAPTRQVVERRELHREESGDLNNLEILKRFKEDPLKVSGVLISRHVSKLQETKGKTTPKGLEVTLLSTHVRPGIMPFLRQDWKMSGFTGVERDRIHSRWNTTPVLPNKSCKQHLKRSNGFQVT